MSNPQTESSGVDLGREYEDLSGYSGRVPGTASAERRPRGRREPYDSAREYMGVLKKGEGKGKGQKAASRHS